MNLNYNKTIPIRGDASFRKFYRRKNKHKTSIIVSANKEKEKNLLNYDAINKLLLKNKILAPKLYNQNYRISCRIQHIFLIQLTIYRQCIQLQNPW